MLQEFITRAAKNGQEVVDRSKSDSAEIARHDEASFATIKQEVATWAENLPDGLTIDEKETTINVSRRGGPVVSIWLGELPNMPNHLYKIDTQESDLPASAKQIFVGKWHDKVLPSNLVHGLQFHTGKSPLAYAFGYNSETALAKFAELVADSYIVKE